MPIGFFKALNFKLFNFQFAAGGEIYNLSSEFAQLANKVFPESIDDSLINSYKETLYRIYNNINEIPLCSYCHNNKTKFYSFTKGYLKHCCSSCATLDPDVKEKLKNTNLEKYGCEHNWSNKDIR